MKNSKLKRLGHAHAKSVPEPRIRYIWQNWGESDEAVQLRIRAMIEEGKLSENDQITIFRWPEPQGGWPPKDDAK
jgi:hypothetical protein